MKFEEEFVTALRQHRIHFSSFTESGDMPDFRLSFGNVNMFVEVKEKRQPVNMRVWPSLGVEEKFVFIVDELTVRKLLLHYPYSGLVVRNNIYNCYTFFSVFALLFQPKARCNRPMQTNSGGVVYKGKWVLNVQNGWTSTELSSVLRVVDDYSKRCKDLVYINECYGEYVGEDIPISGELRTQAHRDHDVNETIYRGK